MTRYSCVRKGGRHTYLFDYKLGISSDSIRISRWNLSTVSENVTINCILRDNLLMPSLVFSKSNGLKEIHRITFNGLFQARERLSSTTPIPWKYHSAPKQGSERSLRCHLNGFVIVGTLGDGLTMPGAAIVELYDDITGAKDINMQRLKQFGGPENSMTHFNNADFTFETVSIHLEQDETNPSSIQIERINLFVTPVDDMVPL